MKRVIPSALLVALACGSCGSRSAPKPADPTTDGLVLVDPGKAPRRIARYAFAKQVFVPLELAMDLDLKLGDRGGPLPTLVMNLDVGTEDVMPDGNARTRTTVKAATARERPSAIGVDQLAKQAASLPGLALVATLSPDGTIIDARTEMDGKAVPLALQSQITSLQQNLEQLAMPLPAQAIGAGAQWKYRKTIDVNGAQLVTLTTVDVVSFSEHALAITTRTAVTGADQRATRDGITVDIKGIHGSGTGTGTIDLSRMTMIGERTMKVQFDMTADGQTSPLDMTLAMRVGTPGQGAQRAP